MLYGQQKSTLTVKSQSSTSTSVDKKIKEMTERFEEIKQNFEELSSKVEEYKKQAEIYSQDVKETSSSLIELNRKIEKINQDLVTILQKIEAANQEISYLKRENIELRQKVETQPFQIDVISSSGVQDAQTTQLSSGAIEFNDFEVLNRKIEQLKKDIDELKETQKLQTAPEIKDPNLRRIITSPYFILTAFFLSVFAIIAAF